MRMHGVDLRGPFDSGRYASDGTPAVHRRDIVSVTVEPIPHGPIAGVFVRAPHSERYVREEFDLWELLPFVPDPLPATLDQGACEFGGDLVIETMQGVTIAYGPCVRPAAVNELWARFVEIVSRGECLPTRGPLEAPDA